ncbi:hypothetical protein ACFSM5_11620 [Lacibacterium aquatile]|uniref:Solute-binding protein family 3/N-terminal domain-containing protein n=1 Tax=Lacibacterium aquatile TaxID=1168082 RepID=A0ABW5DRI7_9PROT
MAHLIDRTPEFTHAIERTNLPRFLSMADTMDGVCHPALLQTNGREQSLLFSQPAYRTLGNRLVATERTAAHLRTLLNQDGLLSFSALEALPRMVIGHSRDRVYGQAIDGFLKRMRDRRETYDVVSTMTAMRMLAAGRLDYTFAAPVQAGYYFARNRRLPGTRLTSFALENVPAVSQSHVVCSRGPVSEKLIARVNSLISGPEFRAAWWPTYERWLDADARSDAQRLLPAP